MYRLYYYNEFNMEHNTLAKFYVSLKHRDFMFSTILNFLCANLSLLHNKYVWYKKSSSCNVLDTLHFFRIHCNVPYI